MRGVLMRRSSWRRRGIIVGSASLVPLPRVRASAQPPRRRPKVAFLMPTAPRRPCRCTHRAGPAGQGGAAGGLVRIAQPAAREPSSALAVSATQACRRRQAPIAPRIAVLHSLAPHSITSSARARSVGEIVRPRAFAVLRLTTSSNFVGCSIGRSPVLSPLKMRPAYRPTSRAASVRSLP